MAVKKYIKFDSEKGYLDNKDDINYFATNQMRKVAFGKMLGDFDENGLYVINEKIVEELIKMPKVIVDIVEGADLIRSKVKADTFFHFILTVEDNKASLKLLEKLYYQSNRDFNSGVYSNINEYVLDEVKVQDKDFDRNALYQKYNISTENDGEVLSIFDMDELSIALYFNIVEKLKVNYLVQNELILKEKQIEAVEADYFEAMLEILAEFPEFGENVTTEVKKDLAEKHNFMIISKPFFQQTVNEVLDSSVDANLKKMAQEKKEQFLVKQRDAKANYYQQLKTILHIEMAKKAGVRFDTNQVVQEEVLGELAQEVKSKGYITSDVRKIVINEDELKLSIAKIRENVQDNEEMCKRDNAKARDITKGRKLVNEFYKELEDENKVDMLKPDTTLIKAVITEASNTKAEEKSTSKSKEESKEDKKATANNRTQEDKKKKGQTNNTSSKGKTDKPKKAQQTSKKPENKNRTTETTATTEERRIEYFGFSGKAEEKKSDKTSDKKVNAQDNGLLGGLDTGRRTRLDNVKRERNISAVKGEDLLTK